MTPVNRTNRVALVLAATLAMAPQALAATTYVKTYAGAALPPESVALVDVTKVIALSIDGVHIPTIEWPSRIHYVEVAPGAHTLRVFMLGGAWLAATAPTLSADFKAGRVYAVEPNISERERRWDPSVVEVAATDSGHQTPARQAAIEYRRSEPARLLPLGGVAVLVDAGHYVLSVDGVAIPFSTGKILHRLSPGTHAIVAGTHGTTRVAALQYLNAYTPVTVTLTVIADHVYYLTPTEDFMQFEPWKPKVADITAEMDGTAECLVGRVNHFLAE